MDTEALIERYRKEIEDLKRRLEEREKDAPTKNRRLSAREVIVALALDNTTANVVTASGRISRGAGPQCTNFPTHETHLDQSDGR